MNGIEAITGAIISEATQKAAEIKQRAENEAKRIVAEAEKEAAARVSAAENTAKELARATATRETTQCDLADKKELAAYRQKLVYEVFDRVFESLSALPDDEYFTLLKKLTLAAADGGKGVVMLNERDKKRFGARLADETGLEIGEKTAAISGGAVVSFGSVDSNASLEVVVRELRERRSYEVSQVLFGKED